MIHVQRAVAAPGIPTDSSLKRWALAALGRTRGELTLRIVGESESRALNARYRRKKKSTNVLSFPYPELTSAGVLGDIVICAPVVTREAREQNKPVRAHWAHMIVHGVLHLLGHDHIKNKDAERMETHERALLSLFGFADPYIFNKKK